MICIGIRETIEFLGQRGISVADHIQLVPTTIREADTELRAFLSIAGDEALRAAEVVDVRIRELGPAAWQDQLPVGLQLVGPVGVNDPVLSTARCIEAELGLLRRHQIE